MSNILKLSDAQFEQRVRAHGLTEAVNHFVEKHGCIPSHIAESEVRTELRDDAALSSRARKLL